MVRCSAIKIQEGLQWVIIVALLLLIYSILLAQYESKASIQSLQRDLARVKKKASDLDIQSLKPTPDYVWCENNVKPIDATTMQIKEQLLSLYNGHLSKLGKNYNNKLSHSLLRVVHVSLLPTPHLNNKGGIYPNTAIPVFLSIKSIAERLKPAFIYVYVIDNQYDISHDWFKKLSKFATIVTLPPSTSEVPPVMYYEFVKGIALSYVGGLFVQPDIIIPPSQSGQKLDDFFPLVESLLQQTRENVLVFRDINSVPQDDNVAILSDTAIMATQCSQLMSQATNSVLYNYNTIIKYISTEADQGVNPNAIVLLSGEHISPIKQNQTELLQFITQNTFTQNNAIAESKVVQWYMAITSELFDDSDKYLKGSSLFFKLIEDLLDDVPIKDWTKPDFFKEIYQQTYYAHRVSSKIEQKAEKPFLIVETTTKPSFLMSVYPPVSDVWVSRTIVGKGVWEDTDLSYAFTYIKDFMERKNLARAEFCRGGNPVFIDVGANIGEFSLFAAKHGFDVYAFEPVPQNYAHLQRSAGLNGLVSKIQLEKHAVSNKGGVTVQMKNEDPSNKGHAAILERTGDPRQNIAEVTTITLDEYLLPKIDDRCIIMMKVDVEGYEGFVFDGAKKLLKENPPVLIFFELAVTQARTPPEKMLETLKSLGYAYIDGAPINPLEDWKGYESQYSRHIFNIIVYHKDSYL